MVVLRFRDRWPVTGAGSVAPYDVAIVPLSYDGDVLERLREDEAVEVRGGWSSGDATRQVVFDLGSGQFLRPDDSDKDNAGQGHGTREVLDEFRHLDVNEEPPIEVVSKVQSWQQQLNIGEDN